MNCISYVLFKEWCFWGILQKFIFVSASVTLVCELLSEVAQAGDMRTSRGHADKKGTSGQTGDMRTSVH